MSTFKSIEDVKKDIINKSKKAVVNADKYFNKKMQEGINNYYAEYSPKMYIRTGELRNSLVDDGVSSTGSGWKTGAKFDSDKMHYETHRVAVQRGGIDSYRGGPYINMKYADASKTLESAMEGYHGGKPLNLSNSLYGPLAPGNGSMSLGGGALSWNKFRADFHSYVYSDFISDLKKSGIPIA